jgi:hypothetical protein
MENLFLMHLAIGKDKKRPNLQVRNFFDVILGWLIDVQQVAANTSERGLITIHWNEKGFHEYELNAKGLEEVLKLSVAAVIQASESEVAHPEALHRFASAFEEKKSALMISK